MSPIQSEWIWRAFLAAGKEAGGFLCPYPFQMGIAPPAYVSPRRVLSDSRREKGREDHTSAARLALSRSWMAEVFCSSKRPQASG